MTHNGCMIQPHLCPVLTLLYVLSEAKPGDLGYVCQTEISLNFSSMFLPYNFVLNSCCCFVFVNIFAGPIRTCWWSWGSGIARNNCTWLEFVVLNYSSLDISDYKIQYSGWFSFSNKWGPVRPVPTIGGGTSFEKYFFWSCWRRFGHEVQIGSLTKLSVITHSHILCL